MPRDCLFDHARIGIMIPTISVIIPTYNRAQLAKRAVKSVLGQSFRDFEVILVDDGSTDHTKEILQGLGDARVRYIYQPNRGPSVARNTGILAARGDYVAFLDSDDRFLPHHLERLHARLEDNPSAGIAHGWAVVVDRQGRRTQWTRPQLRGSVVPKYLFSNPTLICTLLVRRVCFDDGLLFDPQVPPLEDWDMWLRLSFRHDFDCVPEVVAEVAFQETRQTTRYQADHVRRTARAVYTKLLQDPISGPVVRPIQRKLEANVHVLCGHQHRVFGHDMPAARREFWKALRLAPRFSPAYVGLLETFAGPRLGRWLRSARSSLFALRK